MKLLVAKLQSGGALRLAESESEQDRHKHDGNHGWNAVRNCGSDHKKEVYSDCEAGLQLHKNFG
tara:strand:- start:314 stop:505 length:192 start_codon:yes stop_codon:yes gene_type:complete